MSSSAVKPLPLGRSDFSALRFRNCIYVDKTDLLCALCGNDDKVLLVRPRRFGKSLLVSAFASLFRHGLREFQGLKIEKTWTDRTYNVVRLDFSLAKDFSSLEQFLAQFNGMLADAVAEAGLVIESAPDDPVGSFQTLLSRQPQSSLVLLIDEYDAPLTAHLDNRELFEAVQQQLSRFYAAVKSREGCLRFFFMTGITKFANTS
ncbi:MAG: AAA family ATPase, partial [Duodenibacillus sp.]